jgi:chaperone BCS1
MGFSNAFRDLDVTDMADNSTASITQLPANLLEAFIPGYSVISKFVLEALGIDITLVVSVCLLLFGLITASTFLWRHAFELFEKYCMSAISVESHDDIYDHIMAWLSAQKVTQNSRSLMAKTGRESAWDLTNSEVVDEDVDENVLLNFSNWDAKVPPTYEPFFGSHRFWHKGMYFKFSRENKQMMYSGWGGSTVFQNDENIRLTCVGRSTTPIKDLIKEARDCYLNKEKACTVVRRPAPKDQRGRGRGVWHKVATRPSRPMDTVVLDHQQKDRILGDIHEYLHPATPRWYANRGIPYRRGYLFAGPPGTGKSSLAWAIAGVFGLDIYCISLVEPSLTEEDLGLMFTSLPRRCVVLLEDIDSAGLIKRQEADTKADKPKEENAAAKLGAEISKALTTAQQSNDKNNKNNQGISLSGLLNAIDGVASHEGRVLVMTSNFPDKLDDALIRPGRIDMRIDFTKATRSQMSELFTRMYSPDTTAQPTKLTTSSATSGPAPATDVHCIKEKLPQSLTNGHLPAQELTPPESPREATTPSGTTEKSPALITPASDLTAPQLHDIATAFAAKLEEDTFTPAEIQGFLLTRKKEPVRALSEVDAWKVSVMEARDKKKAAMAEKEKGS